MITTPIRRRRCRIVGLSMLAMPLLATSLLPPAALHAQASQASRPGSAALVRRLATELRRTAGLPGLSVAISQGGRVVFAEGFGFADVEARRAVTPATRFRTGSVAKVITATALARLVESGTLDLDAPVQRYVASFPAAGTMTSRQLAGHLAGIAHYTSGDRIEPRFYPTTADALGVFAHVAPIAPPGARYNYSTHGYTLLAAAIEGAAGRPFLEQVEHSVLRPLGMRATGPELHSAPSPDDAVLYSLSDSGPVRVTKPEDPSYKWAGGGMRSSPADLVRMASAYTSGFLRPATVASMFESQRIASGERTGVGIGWRNSFDMSGRRVVEHAGSMQGARSVVALFPDDRVAVAVMANAEWSSSIEETAHLIALAYLGKPAPVRQPVGRYLVAAASVNGRGDTTSLTGSLVMRRGGATLELTPPAGQKRSTHPLVYLERGNAYALVRPDGLYHLTLTATGDSVAGQAIGYGSPRSESPASNAPFLRLQGRRSR